MVLLITVNKTGLNLPGAVPEFPLSRLFPLVTSRVQSKSCAGYANRVQSGSVMNEMHFFPTPLWEILLFFWSSIKEVIRSKKLP